MNVLKKVLKDWRTPRGLAVIGTGGFIIIGVVLLVLAYVGVTFGLGRDKATVVTAVLTFDALLFGAVAAVVALAAYWEASGKPSLSADFLMKYCDDNKPVLAVKPRGDLAWDYIDDRPQFYAELVVHNTTEYAARNPSVRVRLRGISLLATASGWEVAKRANAGGMTELVWDGGADHMIHGLGIRKLPGLTFNGALILPGAPAAEIEVTLLADGIKPTSVLIPLRLVDREGWNQYIAEMVERRGGAIPEWSDASQ